MKRRVIIAISAVVVLAALAGFAWFILGRSAPEPVYQGKTLSAWLQNYAVPEPSFNPTQDWEPEEWHRAGDAIRHMGINAYPFLLEMAQAYDAPWKLKLIALAQKQHLIEVHHVPATDRRRLSSMALTRLSERGGIHISPSTLKTKLPQAQIDQLLPALVKILEKKTPTPPEDLSPCGTAAALLGEMGPAARKALPALLRGATNTNSEGRYACVVALGRIGAEPERVVPVLIKLLGDPNVSMRRNAVEALGEMHALPELSVPALITALKDPDVANVQQSAVRALPKFGAAAKPAAPALLDFVKRQPLGYDFWIRPAVSAIWKIDPEFAALHEAEIGRPSGSKSP